MTDLPPILASWLACWLEALPQTALAVSALLALVMLSRRAVARRFGPRIAYALWLLPTARLFMPDVALPHSWTAPFRRWLPQAEPVAQTVTFENLVQQQGFTPLPATPQPTTVETLASLLPGIALGIWLAGIVIALGLMALRQRRHTQWLERATTAPDDALLRDADLVAAQAGLRRTPRLRIGHKAEDGPCVSGLMAPTLILPAGFERDFTADQRRYALLHEMAHLRRGDLWTATAMMALRIAAWPNPLVHLAWPRFRADQEAACDATVLRLTGEEARADYAETLLVAAQRFSETAGASFQPKTGPALSLSLHHPVKERLMTLRTQTEKTRGAGRWTLAAALLTGAALCAPLSFADDQDATDKAVVSSIKTIKIHKDGDAKGFEIRDENGERTYLETSRDGTTRRRTREQLESEYGIEIDEFLKTGNGFPGGLKGEPGLSALMETGNADVIRKIVVNTDSDSKLKIEMVDGEPKFFRTDEDGNRTEIDTPDWFTDSSTLSGKLRFEFPDGAENGKIRFFDSTGTLKAEDLEGRQFFFNKDGGPASADARLESAKIMLGTTNRMVEGLRAEMDGSDDADLRKAERELAKAVKALEKAQKNMEAAVAKSAEG